MPRRVSNKYVACERVLYLKWPFDSISYFLGEDVPHVCRDVLMEIKREIESDLSPVKRPSQTVNNGKLLIIATSLSLIKLSAPLVRSWVRLIRTAAVSGKSN